MLLDPNEASLLRAHLEQIEAQSCTVIGEGRWPTFTIADLEDAVGRAYAEGIDRAGVISAAREAGRRGVAAAPVICGMQDRPYGRCPGWWSACPKEGFYPVRLLTGGMQTVIALPLPTRAG